MLLKIDRGAQNQKMYQFWIRPRLQLPNYFANQPSIHSSFHSLIMIQDGFAFLPALVYILLLDLDILWFLLTSPLARIIAMNHSANIDLSLARPLNDSCVLALYVSNMKSLQNW